MRIIIRVGDGSLEVRGSEAGKRAQRRRARSVLPAQWESDSLLQSCGDERGRVWIWPRSCGGHWFPFTGFDGA